MKPRGRWPLQCAGRAGSKGTGSAQRGSLEAHHGKVLFVQVWAAARRGIDGPAGAARRGECPLRARVHSALGGAAVAMMSCLLLDRGCELSSGQL